MSATCSFWIGIIVVAISAVGGIIGGNIVKNNWGYWNSTKTSSQNKSKEVTISQETINQLAIKTAEATILKIESEHKSELNLRYKSYEVFGISKNGLLLRNEKPPKGFIIDWEKGKVLSQTDNLITVQLPDMNLKSIIFTGPVAGIKKKIGISETLISMGEYGIKLEVLDIQDGLVIIALGFTI
jgi:hypothetical protein